MDNTSTEKARTHANISRRTLLAGAAAAAGTLAAASPAVARAETGRQDSAGPLAHLEEKYQRRIGLYAKNLKTGQTLTHRPGERFAMCSTFKVFAVAALLEGRLITPDPKVLQRRAPYPPSLVAGDVWAPLTRAWFAQGYVPTMAEVCEAAVRDSDNGAVNLVLQHIGGPPAVTEHVRGIGDRVTRLDRWEPDMSEFEPGQQLDTTTPQAIGTSYANLLLGKVLGRRQREQLTGWMLANRTEPPFRTVLPRGWTIADKTGSGGYATRNDVGIAWTDRGVPLLVSCLTRADDPAAERIDEPLAEVFTLAARTLV